MFFSVFRHVSVWVMQGKKPVELYQATMDVCNVVLGSTCLLLVTISLGSLIWRVLDAVRLHKHW